MNFNIKFSPIACRFHPYDIASTTQQASRPFLTAAAAAGAAVTATRRTTTNQPTNKPTVLVGVCMCLHAEL